LVKEITLSRNGALVVNCRTPEDMEEIKELVDTKSANLKAIKTKVRQPMIRIFGVEVDVTRDDIIDLIIAENQEIKHFMDNNGTNIEDNITVRTVIKRNQRNRSTQLSQRQPTSESNDYLIQLSPQMFRVFKSMKRVLIDMRSYRFEEHFSLTRCFKCQRYGHIAANCKQQESSCGNCGEDHETRNCKNKSTLKCTNCCRHNSSPKVMQKLETNHSVFDKKCKRYEKAVEMMKSRISYE
jgi:hypothetical protein